MASKFCTLYEQLLRQLLIGAFVTAGADKDALVKLGGDAENFNINKGLGKCDERTMKGR